MNVQIQSFLTVRKWHFHTVSPKLTFSCMLGIRREGGKRGGHYIRVSSERVDIWFETRIEKRSGRRMFRMTTAIE